MAFHEGAQKILVGADHHRIAAVGTSDRVWRQQRSCTFHLYFVLTAGRIPIDPACRRRKAPRGSAVRC